MNTKNTLIQVTKNGMGEGPQNLGLTLIKSYFNILIEENRLPKAIVFYNEGIKLICNESPILESLILMEKKGVIMVGCKTCLNYFELTQSVAVGSIGTMSDIVELQNLAGKVINL